MAALYSDFLSEQQRSKVCTCPLCSSLESLKMTITVPFNSGKQMQIKAGYLNWLLWYQMTNLTFWVLEVKVTKWIQTIIFVGTLSI